MSPLSHRLHPALFAAAFTFSTSAAASSDVLTEFTLDDSHTFDGSMSINWSNIGTTNLLNGDIAAGSNSFNFIAQELDVQTTGDYLMGQSQAPVDTVMLVYRGTFDPERPGEGFITGNDDYFRQIDGSSIDDVLEQQNLVPISCAPPDGQLRPERCPALNIELEGNQRYTVVISTFSTNADLGYPQSFFVFGPGFVVVVDDDGVFEIPVQGSRSQPGGAYLDRAFNDLRLNDPDSPLLNALGTQAGLSEAQRARFVQSMSSNVSRTGVRDATAGANRSMLNTLGKRFASTGMGGRMSAGNNLANLLDNGTAQQPTWGSRLWHNRPFTADAQEPHDQVAIHGLSGLSSQLSYQGRSATGEFSGWCSCPR